VNVGDIGLVDFPFTDGTGFKKRPVLVVGTSPKDSNETILVAQITGSARRFASLRSGDMVLTHWKAYNLLLPSVLRCRRLFTIEAQAMPKVVGQVSDPAVMSSVLKEVCALINC
jgi:mRNA interferase MazF